MSNTGSGIRLGFLAAVDVSGMGFVGGLLVTTQNGRPLEFQCTTPVKPNATQKILYGPTLKSYLLGELIGQTLIQRAKVKSQLVLIDDEDMLQLRPHVQIPVGLCEEDRTDSEAIALGRQFLTFHPDAKGDDASVTSFAKQVSSDMDLMEPFERVREALTETIRSAA